MNHKIFNVEVHYILKYLITLIGYKMNIKYDIQYKNNNITLTLKFICLHESHVTSMLS